MGTVALYEPLRAAFTEVYATAARAGANMRVVTHAVELLRETLLADGDVFELWLAFDDQLGQAGTSAFQPAMSELHAQFVRNVLACLVEETAAGGATAWCTCFARCFGDGNWRYELLHALNAARLAAVTELPVPFNDQARLDALEEQITGDRWPETYDWFVYLANHTALEKELRMRMLVIAAEIQLYYFLRPGRARVFLDEAAVLVPDHPRLLIGLGGLHLDRNTKMSIKEAERYFTKVIADRPRLADGYVNLGDLKERASDFSAAEPLYQQAIANAPGTLDGYERLWRLLGNPQWFQTRAERRDDLGRRMKILGHNDADQRVEDGALLRTNGLWEEARNAYRKAIALNPRLLAAHTGVAFAWMEEAADPKTPPERAAVCLSAMTEGIAAVLADFPSAPDAHWVGVLASETAKDWQEAIRRLGRLRELHPEWEPATRLRIAASQRNLGDLTAARKELERVTSIEPENTTLPVELNELGDAANQANEREIALHCFAEARRLRGEVAEADYQNRLGNLHYWFNEYETAAEHYRRAIAITPGDAVMHSNLAVALASIVRPGRQEQVAREQIAELLEARRLAPSQPDYAERLNEARRRLDFITRYGEAAALAYKPAGIPVSIFLHSALVPLVVKNGTSELSPDLVALIEGVRQRVHHETGITLPGWLFSEGTTLPADTMQINLANENPIFADLRAVGSESRRTEMLDRVEASVRPILTQFVMHQETAGALEATNSRTCGEIALNPTRLTAFVRFLRGLAAAGTPIGDVSPLVEQFSRQTNALPAPTERWAAYSWEKAPDGAQLKVILGRELAAKMDVLKTDLEQWRAWILETTGVILPQIAVSEDHELPPFGFRLILNGEPVVVEDGLREDELWVAQTPDKLPLDWKAQFRTDHAGVAGSIVRAGAKEAQERLEGVQIRSPFAYASFELGVELARNGAVCIDSAQVEHRLALIASSHPALVKSVRAHFSRAELVELLRRQLTDGRLLRCFPNALEDLLASPESVANAGRQKDPTSQGAWEHSVNLAR